MAKEVKYPTLHDIPRDWFWPKLSEPKTTLSIPSGEYTLFEGEKLVEEINSKLEKIREETMKRRQYGAYLGGYAKCPEGMPDRSEVAAKRERFWKAQFE